MLASSPTVAGCGEEMARRYALPATLLRAIAAHESGYSNAAVGLNRDGTGRVTSRDVCMMQINSGWFETVRKKFGYSEANLRSDACKCIEVGAWILRQEVDRHGLNWRAVGAYNSPDPRTGNQYAWKIYRQMQAQLKTAPPPQVGAAPGAGLASIEDAVAGDYRAERAPERRAPLATEADGFQRVPDDRIALE